MVNNGAGSFSTRALEEILVDENRVKYFEFPVATTEAVCLKASLKESKGEKVVVYGSYQQITNSSLKTALDSFDDETDIISPWRQHRKDGVFNRLQSKVYNTLINSFAKSTIHDLGCKVRIFRREVLEHTDIYGDMYPYLPILANLKGYRTKEIKCDHYKDHSKTGFYGISMYFNRVMEIFTLYFNTRFTRKPLRFFSTLGLCFFIIGAVITAYVFAEKIFFGNPIGDRLLLLLAILFAVTGIQAASVGLLGEIIAFVHGRHRKEYSIREII